MTGDSLHVTSARVYTEPQCMIPLLGFRSLQRSRAQRSRLPRGSHSSARCVFRVSDSLDALLPFEPSSHFWPGRSWDSPFRELLLSAIRGHFRSPEPSCRCPIQQVHASNETCWTQPSSRFMRPREGLGKPASGPCSRRESVPVRALFRVAPGSIPSWFSSSLGLSPS